MKNIKILNALDSPPIVESLSKNPVQIWIGHLDLPVERIEAFNSILSDEERERAKRFHFEKHKVRYIASHGFLRKTLSKYINIEPTQIKFTQTSKGKPMFDKTFLYNISFNLSHSDNKALIAVTSKDSIGVDIEFIRPMEDLDQLAKRFFSENEYKFINSFSKKEDIFFRIWTLKEAFMKATGEGIAELEDIETVFDDNQDVKIVYKKKFLDPNIWNICYFNPAESFVGAMAVKK